MSKSKVAIVGTVGLPACYGGFETLVENLAIFHAENDLLFKLEVYCGSSIYAEKPDRYLNADLVYMPFNPNGVQSILYDVLCIARACLRKSDAIFVMGVSGALILPVVRFFSKAQIIINIDGLEWKREKWSRFAKLFLKWSEKIAVKYSDKVVGDNQAICDHISDSYSADSELIAYGGDHVLSVTSAKTIDFRLPEEYAFTVCRIEPENNIGLILESFRWADSLPLVIVGNWQSSPYGSNLHKEFSGREGFFLLDPVYDLSVLRRLRENATIYVHGHSAGGTNPSLVEAMHFGVPIVAYDCSYNRYTTEDCAFYFANKDELINIIKEGVIEKMFESGNLLRDIAEREYVWDQVASKYFELLH